MNNVSEYIAKFDEKEVVNAFRNIVIADYPFAYYDPNRVIDITDVEIFLEERCVAFGNDGIVSLIVNEYERRAKDLFDSIVNKEARELAISTYREYKFALSSVYKSDSVFGSLFDWLEEKYKIVKIPMDDFGDENMLLALDVEDCEFDVDHYINPDWYLWDGEKECIRDLALTKIKERDNNN